MQPIGPTTKVVATILNGQSVSQAIPVGNGRAIGINMPAAWTAADLYLLVSTDGGATFNPMYDVFGVEYTMKAAASRYIMLPFADWMGVTHFQLASGPSAGRVNQAADRALTVVIAA